MTNPSPRARLLLAGALLLVLLAQGGVGLFALWRAQEAEARSAARLGVAVAALDSARDAQAAFGLQVQEWKNVLLRGFDAEAAARHRRSFEEASSRMRAAVAAAEGAGIAPPGALPALLRQHEALGAAYAAALAGRDFADPAAARAADAAVRGQDREIQRRLDEAADGFAAYHRAAAREALAAAAEAYDGMRTLLLLTGAGAAILTVALLALLLRRR